MARTGRHNCAAQPTIYKDAGIDPADALHVYRAHYGFSYGHILIELQELIVDPGENEALLRRQSRSGPLRPRRPAVPYRSVNAA